MARKHRVTIDIRPGWGKHPAHRLTLDCAGPPLVWQKDGYLDIDATLRKFRQAWKKAGL